MTDLEQELVNSIDSQYFFIETMLEELAKIDVYTAQHCRRVGNMTDILCEFLGEKNNIKITAHIASYIHDIGKVVVPKCLLTKTGKVTKEEWELIKSHTQIGSRILKSRMYHELADIVLYHHERWDGTGYYNIKGEDIPIQSRIIAVCDSIDAMITKRAYRDPLTLQKCKYQIYINSGEMYEPRIANAALEIFDQLISVHKEQGIYMCN